MKEGFDKLDIAILSMLYNKERFTAMVSCQIKELLDDEALKTKSKMSTSYCTMVRRVRKLIETEYISFGYKEGNAQTYYLNEKGINFLENELMENGYIESEDIEEGGV